MHFNYEQIYKEKSKFFIIIQKTINISIKTKLQ